MSKINTTNQKFNTENQPHIQKIKNQLRMYKKIKRGRGGARCVETATRLECRQVKAKRKKSGKKETNQKRGGTWCVATGSIPHTENQK